MSEPDPLWLRTLTVLLRILALPFILLWWLLNEASGEGRWYRAHRRRMVSERPPLPADELLRSEQVSAEDAALWIITRCIQAYLIGVPSEAIHPQGNLADLTRMRWGVPDRLDIIFPLEMVLEIKIDRATTDRIWRRVLPAKDTEFRGFARVIAQELRDRVAGTEQPA